MTTIVVTGARGYIGSALAKRLAAAGHALRLVSRSSHPMQKETGDVTWRDYVEADLRLDAAWLGLMTDAETIVHLSSRTDLRSAEADPSGDDDINVEPMRARIR